METTETPSATDLRFEKWVADVRNPATSCNEGIRRIATDSGNAVLEEGLFGFIEPEPLLVPPRRRTLLFPFQHPSLWQTPRPHHRQ